MRILAVHNAYRQYGGEDSVFSAEVDLLRSAGHQVDVLHESNDAITGIAAQAATALFAAYNPAGRRKMAEAVWRSRPDIVHVHNFFPRLSPSIFDACSEAGVPIVWTLHNYRVACANGLLFRDGAPCEDCLGGMPLRAVTRRCYRGSAGGSAAVAAMIGWHRLAGTWRNKVTRFIALSEFARGKFIKAGLPPERIIVKPNFAPDPGRPSDQARSGFIYVGRLSVEKGVRTLVEAWREIDAPLTLIGDGPELPALRATAPANVTVVGQRSREEVYDALSRTSAMVLPSECYENCPMTVLEAMALGTPVIASRIGALAEYVEDGITGFHFAAGDAEDLARVVRRTSSGYVLGEAGTAARLAYEARFSPASNLEQLLSVYRDGVGWN